MEYINSRKRLTVDRHLMGNWWCLQYRVKTRLFGYQWITVASCPVGFDSVNAVIYRLQQQRDDQRYYSRYSKGLGFR
jgi:hypothetical protein